MPDAHNDWLNQRDDSFSNFISLGDKKDKNTVAFFENYSRGIATSRDSWCYNFSKKQLADNMRAMIAFYNQEIQRYRVACDGLSKDSYPKIDGFIYTDATKISWNRGIKNDLSRFVSHAYEKKHRLQGFVGLLQNHLSISASI